MSKFLTGSVVLLKRLLFFFCTKGKLTQLVDHKEKLKGKCQISSTAFADTMATSSKRKEKKKKRLNEPRWSVLAHQHRTMRAEEGEQKKSDGEGYPTYRD